MNNQDEKWNRIFNETYFATLGSLLREAHAQGYDLFTFVDRISKAVGVKISEGFHFTPRWKIERYKGAAIRREKIEIPPMFTSKDHYREIIIGKPFDVSCFDGNLALNEGLNLITTLVCGGAADAANASNAQVGTGTGTGAAAATDSALTAGVWADMRSGWPTYGTSQQMEFSGEYGTGTANQDWKEFSVRNKSTADIMLSRKVQDEGTKPLGQIWVLTVTYTGA